MTDVDLVYLGIDPGSERERALRVLLECEYLRGKADGIRSQFPGRRNVADAIAASNGGGAMPPWWYQQLGPR